MSQLDMSTITDDLPAVPSTTQSNTKTKRQRRPKPAPAKPKLFHDQFTSELGQRLTHDTNLFNPYALDPVSVVGRVTKSTSEPDLRSKTLPLPHTLAAPQDSTTTLVQPTSDTSATSFRSSLDVSRTTSQVKEKAKTKKPPKYDGSTFNLDHFAALASLNALIEKHARISHMGILDPSYSFYMNQARDAALYYKVKNKIAVVGGDPLCYFDQIPTFLAEFAKYRKKHGLGIAFLGASEQFASYGRAQKGWVSMKWGQERALNPMTNKVLKEEEGKRIVKQCKQLLDPKRGGVRVNIYVPWQKQDLELQAKLMHVYQTWMDSKNTNNGKLQAYITVFDPFALPHLMVYIYTTDSEGSPNGFAALRMISGGYHIDPYCALPDAPRGITDLLIFSAMSLLERAGVSYLGLGFEPATEAEEVHGMSPPMTQIAKSAYRRTFARLPISGKKAFHDKWYPDEAYDASLYVIYPEGRPSIRHSLAALHFANICVREVVKAELDDWWKNATTKKDVQPEEDSVPTTTPMTKSKSVPVAQSENTLNPPKSNSLHSSESETSSTSTRPKLTPLHSALYSASQVSLIVGIGSRVGA